MSKNCLTSEQLLLILDAVPEIVYIVDINTYEILFANKKLSEILGEDPVGKICYTAIHSEEKPCSFCSSCSIELNKDKLIHVYERFDPLRERYYKCTDQIFSWTDGRLVCLELAVDITEEKLNQEKTVILENIKELRRTVAKLRKKECGECDHFDSNL